jgi:N-acylneuraminate cytidylyltransferase
LGGKPLIAWAIETARQCPSLARVVVSTEDAEIAAVARAYGAEVPFMRPAELAQDDSPEWLVWQHTLRTLETLDGRRPDVLVNIPPTSPFRAVDDVEACVAALLEKDADACITVTPAHRNPYFNMVTLIDGWARVVVQPPSAVFRRQDAPAVFDMTTVAYAARSDFVLRAQRLFEGHLCAVVVPAERALDIDTELDFQFAEFLLQRILATNCTNLHENK